MYVDACCCNVITNPGICVGKAPLDCNIFGCNCGTIDGYCVHWESCNHWDRHSDVPKGAIKTSELCGAPVVQFSMMDSNSDGVISRRDAMQHLINQNITTNSRIIRKNFRKIDANKDGYIQQNEFDNEFKIDKAKLLLLKVD